MASDRFIYERVINAIIEMISKEGYAPGSKLPGVRALAEKFGCNLHTVRKAIAFLSEDGVVEQRMRLGNFVRCDTSHLVGRTQPRVQIVSMRRIGVLLFPALREFSTSLLLELEQEALRRELQLEHHVAASWESAATAMRMMKRSNCRSVIFLEEQKNFLKDPAAGAFLENASLPVVLSGLVPGYESWCYEPRDVYSWFDRDTVRFQLRYFRALGFEHIVCFGGGGGSDKAADRCRYYHECAAADGIPSADAFAGPSAARVDAVLDGWEPLRGKLAVICFDDIEAMRLVIAARKRGWQLPEEMAVMGVNNFVFAEYVDPPLSTVLFPYRYLADQMLRRALDFAEGRYGFGDFSLPRLEVLIRESCGGRQRHTEPELNQLLNSLGAVAASAV